MAIQIERVTDRNGIRVSEFWTFLMYDGHGDSRFPVVLLEEYDRKEVSGDCIRVSRYWHQDPLALRWNDGTGIPVSLREVPLPEDVLIEARSTLTKQIAMAPVR